jgi:chromosome segregation ATPase
LALVAQTRRFEDMSRLMEQLLVVDQQAYLERLQRLMQAAQHATDITNRQAALRAKWIEQFRRESDAVNQRETQLRELANALARVKAEVDALLVRQKGIEDQMLAIQREVANALEEVYRLEAELVAREKQLLQQLGRSIAP